MGKRTDLTEKESRREISRKESRRGISRKGSRRRRRRRKRTGKKVDSVKTRIQRE